MNKRGFTLIEIIIVIVILGILATLALPRITGQMESSKAAEVMNMFGAVRRAAVNCADMANGSGTSCVMWNQLGMTAPTAAKFTYLSGYTNPNIFFSATSNAGGSAGQAICMQISEANGSATYSFSGAPATNLFSGVVQKIGTITAGMTCPSAGAM